MSIKLYKFFSLIVSLFFAGKQIAAQCDPTPVATLRYVSGSGASCVWNYSYSINYTSNSFKSYQMAVSCNGGAFTNVTTCLALTSPGTTTGTTNNFTCPCGTGNTITLQVTYTTSNGSCGGGTQCTEQVNLTTLPVTIKDIQVIEQNSLACIKWQVAAESAIEKYTIEYSNNAADFTEAGTIMASGTDSYSFCDSTRRQQGYYRLRIKPYSGREFYSQVVKFNNGSGIFQLNIFPNPATHKLNIEWPSSGTLRNARFRIFDLQGLLIANGRLTQSFIDLSTISGGVYFLEVTDNNGLVYKKLFTKLN